MQSTTYNLFVVLILLWIVITYSKPWQIWINAPFNIWYWVKTKFFLQLTSHLKLLFKHHNDFEKLSIIQWVSNGLKIVRMPSLCGKRTKKLLHTSEPITLCLTIDCFLVITPILGKNYQTVVRISPSSSISLLLSLRF